MRMVAAAKAEDTLQKTSLHNHEPQTREDLLLLMQWHWKYKKR